MNFKRKQVYSKMIGSPVFSLMDLNNFCVDIYQCHGVLLGARMIALQAYILLTSTILVATKPVFGVSGKARFKSVSSATETS